MSKVGDTLMNCRDVELLMQDYLDGYLLSSQREALEKHLSACPACRRDLLQMKKLEEELEGQVPVEVPPGLEEAISGRLPRGFLVSPWAGRAFRWTGVGLVSTMAALLVLLMFVISPYRNGTGYREVELVFHAPGARSVSVAGDFNSWDVRRNPMDRGAEGSWRLKLHLQPGLYQYNFYIDDGRWAEDPEAPALVSDGFGGRNALLFIEG